jgi:hypothetical protein
MALDLKKLESDLHDALEKETPESLREWLMKQRAMDGKEYQVLKKVYKKQLSNKPTKF